MTEETAEYLLSEPGRVLLSEADALLNAGAETLQALTRLRKSASPEMASAAWEMAELRRRGRTKFGPQAAGLYFVREALEQASGAEIAAYHARRMKAAGVDVVTDLGGGIGGDSLAFARAGLRVILYERDPVRARFAAENVRELGFSDKITVVQADATKTEFAAEAIWLDPARRQNSRRVTATEDYSPPLSWLNTLTAKSIGVKLSPAIDHAVAECYGAELEFLSEGSECREALLWKGEAQSGRNLSATILTADGPLTLAGMGDAFGSSSLRQAGRYLYEPDPAVIRAHLVGTLADQIDAGAMDPHIAYLLSNTLTQTPFARAYEIMEQFPYNSKRLQAVLTAYNTGHVIVKKRGFPLEPDEVRKRLKLKGTQELIVVLARVGSGHQAFLCLPASFSGIS